MDFGKMELEANFARGSSRSPSQNGMVFPSGGRILQQSFGNELNPSMHNMLSRASHFYQLPNISDKTRQLNKKLYWVDLRLNISFVDLHYRMGVNELKQPS